jgi:hypothetical protein
MPLSQDTFRLLTSAAPVCGPVGAQNVAIRRAAIETINRGFDRFVILDAASADTVRVVGYSAATGTPIFAGGHSQGLIVKMFKDSDPNGANAISARAALGAKWEDAIKESASTTC